MGSIDKACIAGFLCRLCSEMHRTVIHIYGDQGKKHGLVEKINGYLPITISPTDPLPKTICETCLRRVEQHYDLLLRLKQYRNKRCNMLFKKINNPLATLCRAPARASIGVNTDDYSPTPPPPPPRTATLNTITAPIGLEDDDMEMEEDILNDTTTDDNDDDDDEPSSENDDEEII